jgi:hypothetical protein
MLFDVVRQRVRGVPVPKEERRRIVPIWGDLRIEECSAEQMGRRLSRVASLHAMNRAINADEIPRLYDAEVLWMSPMAMVLGGIEFEAGVGYCQSWWCVPLDRSAMTDLSTVSVNIRSPAAALARH